MPFLLLGIGEYLYYQYQIAYSRHHINYAVAQEGQTVAVNYELPHTSCLSGMGLLCTEIASRTLKYRLIYPQRRQGSLQYRDNLGNLYAVFPSSVLDFRKTSGIILFTFRSEREAWVAAKALKSPRLWRQIVAAAAEYRETYYEPELPADSFYITKVGE